MITLTWGMRSTQQPSDKHGASFWRLNQKTTFNKVSRLSHKPEKTLWYWYELTHLLRQVSSLSGPLCPEFWDRKTDNNWRQSALICLKCALRVVHGGLVITASDTKSYTNVRWTHLSLIKIFGSFTWSGRPPIHWRFFAIAFVLLLIGDFFQKGCESLLHGPSITEQISV